jgi:hypothetical protein
MRSGGKDECKREETLSTTYMDEMEEGKPAEDQGMSERGRNPAGDLGMRSGGK